MFIHAWRWFGPGDGIGPEQIIQTGAKSIVTALHQLPVGETWNGKDIRERKNLIEKHGLRWDVVESVPVHEDIKKRSGQYKQYIENYKKTLAHLGREKIRTVCYNFMPALDWSRTHLAIRNQNGSESSGFNLAEFAAIDLCLLKRKGAEESYSDEVISKARSFYARLGSKEIERLTHTFLLGFPGSGEKFTMQEVLRRIEEYGSLNKADYQSNLGEFLKEIVPVAEEYGINLAIHPDDPPWPLLGLPRAVSNLEDAEKIIHSIDSPNNGLTFCTGSFGAASTNDLPKMVERLSGRINFLHVRNVSRDPGLNFQEKDLFEGDVDIYSIMRTMILEDIRRSESLPRYAGLPIRPDHGARILGDFNTSNYPGYSLYGRMKNLAELRGLEIGIRRSI